MGVKIQHCLYISPSNDMYISYICYQSRKENLTCCALKPSAEEMKLQDAGHELVPEVVAEGSQYPNLLV
jgi:hypothetical protein